MSHPAIDELKSRLGPLGWLQGEKASTHTQDAQRSHGGRALLLARPVSTEQVAAVVRICRVHGLAVGPQGWNTGLCGGAVPLGSPVHQTVSCCRLHG